MRNQESIINFEQQYIAMLIIAMQDLRNPALVMEFTVNIEPKHFINQKHLQAYTFIKRQLSDNNTFDLVTLTDYVEAQTLQSEFAYFGELVKNSVSYNNIRNIARIIRAEARKREMILMIDSQREIISTTEDPDEAIAQATKLMEQISSKHEAPDTMRMFGEVGKQFMAQITSEMENPEQHQGLSTGFKGLDDILGYKKLIRGSLCVVAARPGMGKTAFMVATMIENAFRNEANTSLVYSQEMPATQLYDRALRRQTGLDDVMFTNHFDQAAQTIVEFHNRTQRLQIFIDDKSRRGIEEIAQAVRLAAKTRRLDFIMIDYLGIMKKPDADRHDIALGEITSKLKELAKELNCVVLLLAQLNRECEKRSDKRPQTSDLKDSGAIEQDADYIIFPYRDAVYDPDTSAGNHAELIVRKNRHGKTGTAYAVFKNGGYHDCDQAQAAHACTAKQDAQEFKRASARRKLGIED